MKYYVNLALSLLIATAVQSPAQYIGSARPLTRGQTLDSLAAKADTLAVRVLQQRVDADSARLDSLAGASLAADTLLKSEIRMVADSTARDTIGGVLQRLKGAGVTRHLNPSDSTKVDSVTISASGGSGGGGYTDYWNWSASDTLTIPNGGAAQNFDLPSIAWPGVPEGAEVYSAHVLLRYWYIYSGGQFTKSGDIYVKHVSGTWTVDDQRAASLDGYAIRHIYGRTAAIASGVYYCGLDVSDALADTAHTLNVRYDDIAGHTYTNAMKLVVQAGLRVTWGSKPNAVTVWGYRCAALYHHSSDNLLADSIYVPPLPEGATIDSAYLLANNWYTCLTVDTLYNKSGAFGIAKSGGAYTDGLAIPFGTHPILVFEAPTTAPAPNQSFGIFAGNTDISSVVDGSGYYAMNKDAQITAGIPGRAAWQAGVHLILSYN